MCWLQSYRWDGSRCRRRSFDGRWLSRVFDFRPRWTIAQNSFWRVASSLQSRPFVAQVRDEVLFGRTLLRRPAFPARIHWRVGPRVANVYFRFARVVGDACDPVFEGDRAQMIDSGVEHQNFPFESKCRCHVIRPVNPAIAFVGSLQAEIAEHEHFAGSLQLEALESLCRVSRANEASVVGIQPERATPKIRATRVRVLSLVSCCTKRDQKLFFSTRPLGHPREIEVAAVRTGRTCNRSRVRQRIDRWILLSARLRLSSKRRSP